MTSTERPPDVTEVVVVCAGTTWNGSRGSAHHIADHLRERCPVLWVDPPVSHVTLARNRTFHQLRERRLRVVAPDLAVLSPIVLPAMRRPIINGTTERLVRWQIRRALRSLGARSTVRIVASDLMLFEDRPGELQVLYAMDDLAAGAELIGVPVERIRRNEARQGASCDLVVAVSPALRDKWAEHADSVFIPNGCDAERFVGVDDLVAADDVVLPRPIAGLVGYLSDRIDLDLLEAVADRGISILLVGKRAPTAGPGRLDEFLARPNVQWVGSRPFEEMGPYLRAMDVGLTPYADSLFNRASFPLKTLEYLAAGRGAVVTDLPAHRWLDTDLIDITSSPAAFADAVSRRLVDAHRPTDVADRQRFAMAHSWAVRADQFAEAVGLERSPVTAGGWRP